MKLFCDYDYVFPVSFIKNIVVEYTFSPIEEMNGEIKILN